MAHAMAVAPPHGVLSEVCNTRGRSAETYGAYIFSRTPRAFHRAFQIDTAAACAATRDAFIHTLPRALVTAATEAERFSLTVELTSRQPQRALQTATHEVLAPIAQWWQPSTFRNVTHFDTHVPSSYATLRAGRQRWCTPAVVGALCAGVGGVLVPLIGLIVGVVAREVAPLIAPVVGPITREVALGMIYGGAAVGFGAWGLAERPFPLALPAATRNAPPIPPRGQVCAIDVMVNHANLLRLENPGYGRSIRSLINPQHPACSDALAAAFATTLDRTPDDTPDYERIFGWPTVATDLAHPV